MTETEEEKDLEPLDEFIVGEKNIEIKEENPEQVIEKEKEIDSLTEIEKNLNYIWDQSHNLFKFSIKGKSYAELVIDIKQSIAKRQYVQACEKTQDFLFAYQMALRDDEKNKLMMKEIFNTLKALQRREKNAN